MLQKRIKSFLLDFGFILNYSTDIGLSFFSVSPESSKLPVRQRAKHKIKQTKIMFNKSWSDLNKTIIISVAGSCRLVNHKHETPGIKIITCSKLYANCM